MLRTYCVLAITSTLALGAAPPRDVIVVTRVNTELAQGRLTLQFTTDEVIAADAQPVMLVTSISREGQTILESRYIAFTRLSDRSVSFSLIPQSGGDRPDAYEVKLGIRLGGVDVPVQQTAYWLKADTVFALNANADKERLETENSDLLAQVTTLLETVSSERASREAQTIFPGSVTVRLNQIVVRVGTDRSAPIAVDLLRPDGTVFSTQKSTQGTRHAFQFEGLPAGASFRYRGRALSYKGEDVENSIKLAPATLLRLPSVDSPPRISLGNTRTDTESVSVQVSVSDDLHTRVKIRYRCLGSFGDVVFEGGSISVGDFGYPESDDPGLVPVGATQTLTCSRGMKAATEYRMVIDAIDEGGQLAVPLAVNVRTTAPIAPLRVAPDSPISVTVGPTVLAASWKTTRAATSAGVQLLANGQPTISVAATSDVAKTEWQASVNPLLVEAFLRLTSDRGTTAKTAPELLVWICEKPEAECTAADRVTTRLRVALSFPTANEVNALNVGKDVKDALKRVAEGMAQETRKKFSWGDLLKTGLPLLIGLL